MGRKLALLPFISTLGLSLGCVIVDNGGGSTGGGTGAGTGSATGGGTAATTVATTAADGGTAAATTGADGGTAATTAPATTGAADSSGGGSSGGGALCGWGTIMDTMVTMGYVCGGSGEDPDGNYPLMCPANLMEGADCGDVPGQGCCDGDSLWYCGDSNGTKTLVKMDCPAG